MHPFQSVYIVDQEPSYRGGHGGPEALRGLPKDTQPQNNPGFYLSLSRQDSPKPSLLGGRPGWSTHSLPTSPLSPCKVTHTGGPRLLQVPKTGLKGPGEKRDYAHCPRRKMWRHMRKDSKTVLSSAKDFQLPSNSREGRQWSTHWSTRWPSINDTQDHPTPHSSLLLLLF